MGIEHNIYFILHHISAATILLPLFICLYQRKTLPAELKVLRVYIILRAAFEAFSVYLSGKGLNSLYLVHAHTIIQFLLLGLVFWKVFSSRLLKIAIIISIISFTIFALIDAFYIDNTSGFNTYAGGVEALLLILLVLIFFYQVFHESKISNLEKHPMFLISTGILLYFSGNLFLFIFSNYILAESEDMLRQVWSIHSVLNILLNVFFALGLWFSKEKQVYR